VPALRAHSPGAPPCENTAVEESIERLRYGRAQSSVAGTEEIVPAPDEIIAPD